MESIASYLKYYNETYLNSRPHRIFRQSRLDSDCSHHKLHCPDICCLKCLGNLLLCELINSSLYRKPTQCMTPAFIYSRCGSGFIALPRYPALQKASEILSQCGQWGRGTAYVDDAGNFIHRPNLCVMMGFAEKI